MQNIIHIEGIPNPAGFIEQYHASPHKRWIKIINDEDTISFENYERNNYFVPLVTVVLDNELAVSGKKQGLKKRDTVIKYEYRQGFTHKIMEKIEWLYLFTINGKIVKIGGTRTGIKLRLASYLCGHHTRERGKSGGCSATNGFIYNTFEFYLNLGCTIQMYGYELPRTETVITIFEKPFTTPTQTYHVYESAFLEDYKSKYEIYPVLSSNSDPMYK